MKQNTKHNLIVALPVLLIRLPILMPLWLLARVGEWAEAAGDAISHRLPGFKR